jgi:hypothetical protein
VIASFELLNQDPAEQFAGFFLFVQAILLRAGGLFRNDAVSEIAAPMRRRFF